MECKIHFASHYFDNIINFCSSLEEHVEHTIKNYELCKLENIKLKIFNMYNCLV